MQRSPEFTYSPKCGLLALTLTITGTADVTQRKIFVIEGEAKLNERPVSKTKVRVVNASLPLYILRGQSRQADEQMKFVSRGSSHILFLTSDEAVLVLNKADEQSAVMRNRLPKGGPRIPQSKLPVHSQDVLRIKVFSYFSFLSTKEETRLRKPIQQP